MTTTRLLTPLVLTLMACAPDRPSEDTSATGSPEDLWTLVGTNAPAALMSVTGTSDTDVWAVGAADASGGTILHWDGAAWTRIAPTDVHDLWWGLARAGSAGTEFVAVGAGGMVLRGDTTGFTRIASPGLGAQTLYGAWSPPHDASLTDDLWAVGGFAGRDGFVWRLRNERWTPLELPDDLPRSPDGETPGFFKVWGSKADDVYVVGSSGTLLHWDGRAFQVVPTGTSELLFTVHGNGSRVVAVGPGTVLLSDEGEAFTDVTPAGAGVLQGVQVEPDGTVIVTGASGTMWVRDPDGVWEQQVNTTGVSPESLHAVWTSPEGTRWAVGGSVLSASLDAGVIVREGALPVTWTAPTPPPPAEAACPADAVDPAPGSSIARRWNEQILGAIRRDVPRPGVHARNLFHLSVSMWDAWAIYDEIADPMVVDARVVVADPAAREAAREVALSYAAYRVLAHRYPGLAQTGSDVTAACLDDFMGVLGLDTDDAHTVGDDPVAIGNRVGATVIAAFADDGANEANNYADTTSWRSVNAPLVVDRPGADCTDPDVWQPLNLAAAETQNGIVLDAGVQGYIGAQWGIVTPFALGGDSDGAWSRVDPGAPTPSVHDADAADWVLDVLRKHAALDPALPATLDISPGAYGNNRLGANDGRGRVLNPVTGAPYAPNVVKLGDFARVLAEFWADGPRSETPPGHWNTLANDASDARTDDTLVVAETGAQLDRLAWDVHLYLALNGALHDAAIAAWGVKRAHLGSRPLTMIRWMADHGQRSRPDLPSYDPDGLPLEDGVVELITPASGAPGERHHALRWHVGEVAVKSWRGEPGDRAGRTAGVGWMRARDWFPYQRRTFVTPAFPGFISGHSTFSRAAAEVLTRFTGSPYVPGGLGAFRAPAGRTLVFEDGPSTDVTLQWATWQDAADQAGQSRIWGGIHLWPDDRYGREVGGYVGNTAMDAVLPWFEGTARAD